MSFNIHRLALAAPTIAMLALLGADLVSAQGGDALTISIATSISAEPAAHIPFPIRVGPAAAIPRNSFIRVRGLPPMAALSEGYSIAPGAWAIPLNALADVKLTLATSAEGTSDFVVTLIAVDGSVLAEARSTLIVDRPGPTGTQRPPSVGAASAPSGAVDSRAPPQPVPAERPTRSATPLLPEERERALKMKQKGDEQLAQGLIAPARLLYERAADLGLAQAAIALAATYDAAELTSPHLRGVKPDPNEAKRWYERARTLGAGEADQRLRRLGANQ